MNRTRSIQSLGLNFTVVAVEDRLKGFEAWDADQSSNKGLITSSQSQQKGLGSRNELVIKRGDIIKVLAACNPDGSKRRPVRREAKRLSSGFLDPNAPAHDPYDKETWWIGTIVNKRGKETKTGRFPQRSVAMMAELRQKNQTFRCKMCSRMQKSFVTHDVLNSFGITGQPNHLFGARDLCDGCGPKILRVVKSVAQAVLANDSNDDIIRMLKQVARRKLVHETAVEAYALTPERVPVAPPARRPENFSNGPVVSSPRANAANLRRTTPPLDPPGRRRRDIRQENNAPSSLFSSEIIDSVEDMGPATDSVVDNNVESKNVKPSTPLMTNVKNIEKQGQINPEADGRLGDERTLLPGLSLIFKNTCAKEGHITKAHLLRMVRRLAKDHSEARDFICDDETAQVIIDSLDADGNGTVEFEEWSQWILRGATRTQQERDRFKNQNNVLFNTMMFLETIALIAKKLTMNPSIEELRPALVRIFHNSMTDAGHLSPSDIKKMVKDLSAQYTTVSFFECTDQVAETIVQSLDDDGNGAVEMEEFIPWLMTGMVKDQETRTRFAEQGETFALLISFMESLGKVANIMTSDIEKIRPGLETLFQTYSSDGTSMTSEDLQFMVDDLSKKYEEDVEKNIVWFDCDNQFTVMIINSLDGDGNGLIELHEWSNWMLKGVAKSDYTRDKFAAQNENFQKLSLFVKSITNVAKRISQGRGADVVPNTVKAKAPPAEETAKSNVVLKKPSNTILVQRRDRIRKSDCLRRLPAFASLNDDYLNAIIDTMEFQEFDDDDPLIVEQGKIADRVYVILAGQVSIMAASGKQGWPAEKMRIGELETFGVEALLGLKSQRYSISGVACDEVQVMCLTVPENAAMGDDADAIVQAARQQREKEVGAKFGRKFRNKYLERRKSSENGTGTTISPPATAVAAVTKAPSIGETVAATDQVEAKEEDDAKQQRLKEEKQAAKKAARQAKHRAMMDKQGGGDQDLADEWG